MESLEDVPCEELIEQITFEKWRIYGGQKNDVATLTTQNHAKNPMRSLNQKFGFEKLRDSIFLSKNIIRDLLG